MKQSTPARWIPAMFVVHMVGMVNSLISDLTMYDGAYLSRAVTVCIIVCLVRLSPVDRRYRSAAVFQVVALGCKMVCSVLYLFAGRGLVAIESAAAISSVFSWALIPLWAIAAFYEYWAHGALLAKIAPRLAKSWHILFFVRTAYSLLSAVVTQAVVRLFDLGSLSVEQINALSVAMQVLQWMLNAVYWWHLYRTARLVRKE